MQRAVLIVLGLIFLALGLYSFLQPQSLAGSVGITFDAVGRTDVQATYGGVQAGFGLFLIWVSRTPSHYATAFAAIAFLLGGIGLCRLAAPLLGGGWSTFHTGAAIFEVAVTMLCIWQWRRTVESPQTEP